MQLWKETFHDSDEYIELVFDNLYNPELTAVHYEGNKLVSALLGVPYSFRCGSHSLSSLYLCGLATRPEFRRRGIMESLMQEILDNASKNGFAMAFLIPANSQLIGYYHDRGWNEAIYRVEDHYTELHNFIKNIDNENLYENLTFTRIEYFRANHKLDGNIKFSNLAADYLQKWERGQKFPVLIHDSKMTDIVIQENALSNGEVWIATKFDSEVVAAAFTIPSDAHDHTIEVRYIVADNVMVEQRLLQHIKESHPDSPMTVWRFPELTTRHALWEPVYSAADETEANTSAFAMAEKVYDVAHNAHVYGMAKILKLDEILKFLNESNGNLKKPILAKIVDNQIFLDHSSICMSLQDFQGIIFRHPDSDRLIGEAFGIPRLPLNMSLLLD